MPHGGFRETDIEEVQGVQAFEESTFGYTLCNTLRSDKLDEREYLWTVERKRARTHCYPRVNTW